MANVQDEEVRISGIPASPGIAIGPLLVLDFGELILPRHPIEEGDISKEIERLRLAIEKTKEQLLQIQQSVRETIGQKDAEIFEAHLLVLEDSSVLNAVFKQLNMKRLSIEYVYYHVAFHYADAMAGLDDPYLRERATDIRDVARRVLANLVGDNYNPFSSIREPCIIVAHDLTPSDTAQLPRDSVLGFVTAVGSKTSHSAIMARSMDIPAVVALQGEDDLAFPNGAIAILDGNRGVLILNPRPETLAEFTAAETRHEEVLQNLERLRDTEAVTRDKRHIVLSANIEVLSDLPAVIESGAEGIGLFRTEFLFVNRDELPNEEDQYQIYLQVARLVKPHRVIIRTLDVGGDKRIPGLGDATEMNPFLGVRAIRLCLANPELFRIQLRAILRATVEGNVAIMYPMISGVDEIRQANALLYEEADQLRNRGVPVPTDLEIGAMIEVPSAALTAEVIATEVRFFSIGSNDLIQYCTAIDRGNQKLAHLYEPTHPGVLRLIEHVVTAAHSNDIWVGICGEMASEFILAPLLIGMGVDEFSVGAAQVSRIKHVIQSVAFDEMKAMADRLLNEHSGQVIYRQLEDLARSRFPELFE